jgi:hypothetical protein
VRHPLVEAELTKADIRARAARSGSNVGPSREPVPVVAIPYGTKITHERSRASRGRGRAPRARAARAPRPPPRHDRRIEVPAARCRCSSIPRSASVVRRARSVSAISG